LETLELADLAKMSLIDCTEGLKSFFSGLLTILNVSSSVVELARQDMPNFDLLEIRSSVLGEDKSSFDAFLEVLNEVAEEIDPILGTS
jgi:hypothetical protein